MAELIGFEQKSFTFEDGKRIEGYYLYTAESRNGVTGLVCSRDFLSVKKLGNYVPVLGDHVTITFNRFGKPQAVIRDGGQA